MSFKKNKKLESNEAEHGIVVEQEPGLEAEETLQAEPVPVAEPEIAVQAAEPELASEIAPEPDPVIVTAPLPAVAAKKLSMREQARLARAENYETMLRKRHPHLSDEKIHKLLKSYV